MKQRHGTKDVMSKLEGGAFYSVISHEIKWFLINYLLFSHTVLSVACAITKKATWRILSSAHHLAHFQYCMTQADSE